MNIRNIPKTKWATWHEGAVQKNHYARLKDAFMLNAITRTAIKPNTVQKSKMPCELLSL